MKSLVRFLSSCFLLANFSLNAFQTLAQIIEFAHSHPSAPESDVEDWRNPSFKKYFAQTHRGLFAKLKNFVSPEGSEFEQLLKQLEVPPVMVDEQDIGTLTLSLDPKKKPRIFFFGDLHGAFDSFARDLLNLQKEGIIDDNLRLIPKNTYIVFLGNVLGGTPYSIKLLEALMSISQKNPGQVVIVRAERGRNNAWKNLDAVVQELRALPAVTYDSLSAFAGKLPDRLVILYGLDEVICSAPTFSRAIRSTPQTKVILHGGVGPYTKQLPRGLEFSGFFEGAAEWLLLSCPTALNQTYLHFYFDSYLELCCGADLAHSTFVHYAQDVRTKKGFTQERYDPITGCKLSQNAPSGRQEILIGSTGALFGGLTSIGGVLQRGVEKAFILANEQNTIPGHYIRPVFLDDFYVPGKARANVERLAEEFNIDLLVMPQGSQTLEGYLDLVRAGKVAVLFPYTGAPQFRMADLKYIVHYRPSYEEELVALIDFVVNEYEAKRFASIYQDDAFGNPLIEIVHRELKKHGIAQGVDIPYSREQTIWKEQIVKLVDSNSEAIAFLLSSLSPVRDILSALGPDFFIGKYPFALYVMEDDALTRFLTTMGIKFTMTSLLPDIKNSDLEIVKEYRYAMDRFGYPYDVNDLEGFIAGSLTVEALRVIGKPYTKERVLAFFEGLKGYKFKGLTLTFDAQTRSFKTPIWVKSINDQWKLYPVQEKVAA